MSETRTETAVSRALATARGEDRAALVGYLPVGYPSVEGSIEAMRTMVRAGVDIVEIGLPYTDPLMDGPVIQTAATGALAAGVHVDDVFRAARAVTDEGAACVVMTYWNPVLRRGVEKFAADLAAAGGSGLVTPDLVPDEAADWLAASDAHDLDRIFLVAPSSTTERLVSTTAASRGFVYAAALMGVTGARSALGSDAAVLVDRVRQVSDIPVCVGLGVSTAEQAHQVAQFADGVIVGSALVSCLVDAPDDLDRGLARLDTLARELAAGVRR
ncbi:tryptophan synthase subunit alpha [Flexivirga sp. ID2601S]|uniref:Tryptophan synthase alpha chain n=1 Tax=Flexivirga aerilata TaxID=1656889 RepID=A0A849ALJ2_9MICO|nr:tryptophan synthase subunit alpha [Flexivirga aerilata]